MKSKTFNLNETQIKMLLRALMMYSQFKAFNETFEAPAERNLKAVEELVTLVNMVPWNEGR